MDKGSAKIKRVLIASLLMFVLSFGTVFAETEMQSGAVTGSGTETEEKQGADRESSEKSKESAAPKVSHIVKRGKYYYYKDPETGKIRKDKGFVRDNGKLYYIGSRGRIVTGKKFKVEKKYYRAFKSGRIATGVYKWKKHRYYSNPNTGQWIKKEKIVTWKGDKYYIRKGGDIAVNDVFTYDNLPYKAGSEGKLKEIPIPDNGNVVMDVAKKQVGIMTGKKYWKWYFHTRFRDADATPWCGVFVAWCFHKAGVYDKVKKIKNHGNLGYVPSYTSWANSHNKWVKKSKAKGGDIIIYAGSVHVGLVEGVWKDYLITIEGNAGPTAYIRGEAGAVVRKLVPIDSWKVKGIIRVF